jgi:hypothetical protein
VIEKFWKHIWIQRPKIHQKQQFFLMGKKCLLTSVITGWLTVALFVTLSVAHRQCYRSKGIGVDHTMTRRAQVSFQLTKLPRHPQDVGLFISMLVQKVLHWIVLLTACPSNSAITAAVGPPPPPSFVIATGRIGFSPSGGISLDWVFPVS